MLPYIRSIPETDLSTAAGPRPVVAQLRERVVQWSPELSPDSPTAKAATLLLASRTFGQNVDRLALITDLPRDFVARCARRLVDNGVWADGRVVSAWQDAEGDSLAFWADVGVAEGKLCRRVTPDGRLEWAPAGHWHKCYDYIRRADPAEGSIRYHEVHQPAPEATVSVAEPRSQPQRSEAGRSPSRPASDPSSPPPAGATAKPPSLGQVRHLGSPDLFADTVWLT